MPFKGASPKGQAIRHDPAGPARLSFPTYIYSRRPDQLVSRQDISLPFLKSPLQTTSRPPGQRIAAGPASASRVHLFCPQTIAEAVNDAVFNVDLRLQSVAIVLCR